MKYIFSKPKLVIPLVAIIATLVGWHFYNRIGIAPVVTTPIPPSISSSTITPGTNIDLAFPKSGRIESVTVKSGDIVREGQILARLSAPDAEGAINQAKGALDLARAQLASLNSQYATTKNQQDLLVANAYKTLLTSDLEGVPDKQDPNIPIISGTYTCAKEGSYILDPYTSGDSDSGFSLNYSGLETGTMGVKYDNPVPLGSCGLQIKFAHVAPFNQFVTWTIAIPNTKGASYTTNKNAYDLAGATRDKVLADLATTIGQGSNGSDSVAQAQVAAAEGAYQAALGAYQNNVIAAPATGLIDFVDKDLKVGQAAISNKTVISITAQ